MGLAIQNQKIPFVYRILKDVVFAAFLTFYIISIFYNDFILFKTYPAKHIKNHQNI